MSVADLAQMFAQGVGTATGLNPETILRWAGAEGAYAPNGTGGFNFLNLRAKDGGTGYSGVSEQRSPGGFARFGDINDAIQETSHWINNMGNYGGIRATRGRSVNDQLAAIAASPWDAGHYGGGSKFGVNPSFAGQSPSVGTGAQATSSPGGAPVSLQANGSSGNDAVKQALLAMLLSSSPKLRNPADIFDQKGGAWSQ